MKKEASWLYSKCAISVLVELARKPCTPMQLRVRTRMTKNNYANIILKRFETEGIVKCLNPDEKIGRVFCIRSESAKRVEKIFEEKGIKQKVNPLPSLIWIAYGRLLCKCCTQLRAVFKKANELRLEGRRITVLNLREKLPKMAVGDIYRALYRLVKLQVISCKAKRPKRFIITQDGLDIIEFEPDILLI